MKKVNWKVYNEALGALQAQFTKWDASLGLKSPEEAAKYANRVLDAAMAAENFVYNGYVVDYGGGDQ